MQTCTATTHRLIATKHLMMTTPCWIAYLRQSYASNIRSSATFPTISHDTSVQNNFDYHIGREIFMLFGSFVFSKKYTNSSCISFFVVDRSAMAVVVPANRRASSLPVLLCEASVVSVTPIHRAARDDSVPEHFARLQRHLANHLLLRKTH